MATDNRQPAELSPTERFNKLNEVFGTRPLARMLRTRAPHLLAFAAGDLPLGGRRQERLDYLYDIVEGLSGSYNALGINQWFDRPRKTLGRQTPRGVLESYPWRSQDRQPRHIVGLVKSLCASPAT